MPYDMSLEILSNFILHSKDWYVRLLAEYLGVKGFEEAGGLAWFGHEGYIQGCRVYLGEFVREPEDPAVVECWGEAGVLVFPFTSGDGAAVFV